MTVAIKLVELTAPRGQAKAQLTEAKIATSLQHPNVVRTLLLCAHAQPCILHINCSTRRMSIQLSKRQAAALLHSAWTFACGVSMMEAVPLWRASEGG